jgi:two-component system NtrC family sensor kinase
MTKPIRILCVDDEKNVLRALERLFLDEDYEILTAQSGKEGLQILAQGPPVQIVVSDYRMPEMNGVDFLREVCWRWPDTVRIVLSGYADTASIVAAINEGQIYKFIPKPWNDDELKVTIGNAIELYHLHRENEQLLTQLQQTNDELNQINENLEELVIDRTTQLEFHNKALRSAQNILDNLPVGVVGIDTSGAVVYCNALAGTLIHCNEDGVLGACWREELPAEVVAAFEPLIRGAEFSARALVQGRMIRIKSTSMREPDQEGFILVLDPEGG